MVCSVFLTARAVVAGSRCDTITMLHVFYLSCRGFEWYHIILYIHFIFCRVKLSLLLRISNHLWKFNPTKTYTIGFVSPPWGSATTIVKTRKPQNLATCKSLTLRKLNHIRYVSDVYVYIRNTYHIQLWLMLYDNKTVLQVGVDLMAHACLLLGFGGVNVTDEWTGLSVASMHETWTRNKSKQCVCVGVFCVCFIVWD